MTAFTITLIVAGVAALVGGFVAYKWLTIFNSADGEWYAKQRMQGPFVPLPPESGQHPKPPESGAGPVLR